MKLIKNKKAIDPRYFLNETALREENEYDDRITTALAHVASGVMCENPEMADWEHYFSDLRWKSNADKRIIDLIKELEETAREENWPFAGQALYQLADFYEEAGLLDREAYNKLAHDLCREPSP